MIWTQLLAYVTGTVNQELLLRNEYLAAENRILKAQIKGRLRTNIGNVAALDDAVGAFNPTERIKGKTIIRVQPLPARLRRGPLAA